jgi:hypothetical protein
MGYTGILSKYDNFNEEHGVIREVISGYVFSGNYISVEGLNFQTV